MTEAQGYVERLSQFLAEYRSDPEKCEAIMRLDLAGGGGLLHLLIDWYAADHPDRVTVTHGVIESVDSVDVVCRVRAGKPPAPDQH
ncbi:hypothetical protein J0H58_36270 [bacterium]|nr:hypothetical protein [bacterium]